MLSKFGWFGFSGLKDTHIYMYIKPKEGCLMESELSEEGEYL